MRATRGVLVLLSIISLGFAGCSSSSANNPRTVFVTETVPAADTSADSPANSDGSVPPTAVPTPTGPVQTAADNPSESAGGSESVPTPTGNTVAVDPLTADCLEILDGTTLEQAFGTALPAQTRRITQGANPDRGLTGRLRCLYGVGADGVTAAVTVVLAQYESAAAAAAQIGVTVGSEEGLGAASSIEQVRGWPSHVLLRDGGMLVLGYDDWTLSVVAAAQLVAEDELPGALTATADHVLGRVIG